MNVIVLNMTPGLIVSHKNVKKSNEAGNVFIFFVFSEGGVDARSPDGTAASFSKANRNALRIANSSLFYEFASNEILNSLHK